MNYRKITFFIYIALFLGCQKQQEQVYDEFQSSFKDTKTESVVGENIALDMNELFFSYMFEMTYINDMVLINDFDSEYNLKIVDLENKSVRRFGKKGRGPYEMKSAMSSFSIDYVNNLVYVTDNVNYYQYSSDSLKVAIDDPLKYFEIKNNGGAFIYSTYANGNQVMGSMFEKRIGLINLDDFKLETNYEYETGGPLTNQAYFFNHPSKEMCVYFHSASAIMGIVKYQNGTIETKEKFWWRTKSKEVNDGQMRTTIPDANPRNGFITATVSSKYIYALYSGKTLKNKSKDAFNDFAINDIVYVFDWEGKPVKKYALDQQVRSIAINEKEKILYAASYAEDEPHLIKFNL